MPFIDVRISQDIKPEQAKKISDEITRLMADLMGKRKEVTAVCIQSMKNAAWTIGAKPASQAMAYVDVKITAGTNTAAEKASLVANMYTVLADTLGGLAEASYIVVHELPADSWGYAGKTQAARKLSSL